MYITSTQKFDIITCPQAIYYRKSLFASQRSKQHLILGHNPQFPLSTQRKDIGKSLCSNTSDCLMFRKKIESNWEVLLREISFSCQLSLRWITLSWIAEAAMKSNIFAAKTILCIFLNCIRQGLLFKIRCYCHCHNILHYSNQASIPLVSLSFAVKDANTGLCCLE